MKFPYGICDFYDIITDNYLYIDRTDRIPVIENAGKHLLFLRPRRFGKTLLLSMLENYYDVAKEDEFEKLFGQLGVGKNPTQRHNRYFVMKWDFSAIDPQGNSEQIRRAMHNHINGCIEQFIAHYEDRLSSITIDNQDCLRSFQSVLAAVHRTPNLLYLLIDEYDNFANEVMMGSRDQTQRYKDLLYGEGSLKTVFKAVKSASAGRGLDRVFITGVSPVVLSDITSGYNIAENIYLMPKFDDLCGFTESEIVEVIKWIIRDCDLPEEKASEAINMMRTFYNGYCFSDNSDHFVTNPTLALFFMKSFQENCQYPQNMLDGNLAMDRDKLVYISRMPGGANLIQHAIEDDNSLIIQRLSDRFGVEDMLNEVKDKNFMLSLLYFFGILTFSGKITDLGDSILKIPNLVIRKFYAQRILDMFLPDVSDQIRQTARDFYRTGSMRPVCDFIEQRYFKIFDNRDYRWVNELTIKTAFLTLLFNDFYYIMDSETVLERGYADMTMIVRPDMRRYPLLDFLMEFKYISLKDVDLSGEKAKRLTIEELKTLAPVRMKLTESKTKLEGYQKRLLSRYGNGLNLKTYTVVAIGLERLVWEELSRIDSK